MNPRKSSPQPVTKAIRLKPSVTDYATFVAGRLEGAGHDRARLAKDQAEQACALGRELGLLSTPEVSWEHFKGASESHLGTEHLVEFDEELDRMVKITLPPNLA